MKLRVTSHGRPASRHARSEDAFAVTPLPDGGVLCVLSDGVGSGREPRLCAERIVRLLSDNFAAHPRDWPVRKAFERLVEQVNASLHAEGTFRDGVSSMQATLTAVCLTGSRLQGVNVGDSPALLVRNGIARRLSEAHVALTADGQDVLTRSVGQSTAVELHYFEESMQEGDLILLASDGLTDVLPEMLLGDLAGRFRSARTLVQEAVQRSGDEIADDLSAILAEVEEISPEPAVSSAPPPPLLTKNLELDGYHLLRPMAGNERVWLAEKDGRRFVLKFAPRESEFDDTIRARFAHEAWNACRFESDFFIPARRGASPHWYVMDYVEAPSLRFLLKSRQLGVDETVELGRFLCKAGQWLLRHDLVHGDIKPDNLLAPRGEHGDFAFKLLDLGVAAPVFTDAGVSGTASYLAPERFAGAVLTERTEIYSIGATLYEMLTGRPPHGYIERFQKPVFGAVRRPSASNPNVPRWLDTVILKCLATQPQRRFQSYSELLFALEHPDSVQTGICEEPLLIRNPLLFYKIGFWLLLATTVILLFKLVSAP